MFLTVHTLLPNASGTHECGFHLVYLHLFALCFVNMWRQLRSLWSLCTTSSYICQKQTLSLISSNHILHTLQIEGKSVNGSWLSHEWDYNGINYKEKIITYAAEKYRISKGEKKNKTQNRKGLMTESWQMNCPYP